MNFCDIKILSDENISPKVISFLRENNIDVLDTKEQKWFGKSDDELLEIAFKQNRFVLTHDADFGTLVINEGCSYYGIIYLRPRNLKPENVIRMCGQLLNLKTNILVRSIIVVEESRLRMRVMADE